MFDPLTGWNKKSQAKKNLSLFPLQYAIFIEICQLFNLQTGPNNYRFVTSNLHMTATRARTSTISFTSSHHRPRPLQSLRHLPVYTPNSSVAASRQQQIISLKLSTLYTVLVQFLTYSILVILDNRTNGGVK